MLKKTVLIFNSIFKRLKWQKITVARYMLIVNYDKAALIAM